MVATCLFLFFHLTSIGYSTAEDSLSVRVITWNLLSNSWMGGKFDSHAVKSLLAPIEVSPNVTIDNHDIVVVALQESCYKCNKGNEKKLAEIFLRVLRTIDQYEFVAIAKTRNSRSCEWWACNTHQFGTAAILIFARPSLLVAGPPVHVNGCDGIVIHNAEKGVAGVRTIVKATGKSICFAGLHLDSKKHKNRRSCLTDFWNRARSEASWHSCDSVIMTGDFNTRPGPNKDFFKGSVSRDSFGDEFFKKSWANDEMVGVTPWGGDRLLDHIKKVSEYDFEEDYVNFMPTYSIQPLNTCGPKPPCFKGIRQPAWTDRIIYANCKSLYYDSMYLGKSDHDPVVGILEVQN